MKKFIKITALLLCIAMLTSTFAGCGLFGGGDDYEEPKQPVKKSSFNNFQQNDYDFEKLEEELLDN